MIPKNSLPVGPLTEMIDRMLSRSTDPVRLLERLGTEEKQLYRMHHGQRSVTHDFADEILSHSPYLWFDVWMECSEHTTPNPECVVCVGYHRAALMFGGEPLPDALAPPKRRPRRTCQNPRCTARLPRGSIVYCPVCRATINEVRRTLTEGMWADGFKAREMADALSVDISYFSLRRCADGWDLPHRNRRPEGVAA